MHCLQTKRGGRMSLFPLSPPQHDFAHAKGDAQHVLENKLALERLKYTKLDGMHKVAEQANDVHFQDLLEEKMGLQLVIIKQNADWVNQLRRVGPGHGAWDWDSRLQAAYEGKASALSLEEAQHHAHHLAHHH
jgi:ferritin heavy chain